MHKLEDCHKEIDIYRYVVEIEWYRCPRQFYFQNERDDKLKLLYNLFRRYQLEEANNALDTFKVDQRDEQTRQNELISQLKENHKVQTKELEISYQAKLAELQQKLELEHELELDNLKQQLETGEYNKVFFFHFLRKKYGM